MQRLFMRETVFCMEFIVCLRSRITTCHAVHSPTPLMQATIADPLNFCCTRPPLTIRAALPKYIVRVWRQLAELNTACK
jgi:hypothetical protein